MTPSSNPKGQNSQTLPLLKPSKLTEGAMFLLSKRQLKVWENNCTPVMQRKCNQTSMANFMV